MINKSDLSIAKYIRVRRITNQNPRTRPSFSSYVDGSPLHMRTTVASFQLCMYVLYQSTPQI